LDERGNVKVIGFPAKILSLIMYMRQEQDNFLYSTGFRPAPQLAIQGVLGAVSLGVKRQGSEADHSPPSRRDNFTFTFTLFHDTASNMGYVTINE
jgi:hypothetical protein